MKNLTGKSTESLNEMRRRAAELITSDDVAMQIAGRQLHDEIMRRRRAECLPFIRTEDAQREIQSRLTRRYSRLFVKVVALFFLCYLVAKLIVWFGVRQ